MKYSFSKCKQALSVCNDTWKPSLRMSVSESRFVLLTRTHRAEGLQIGSNAAQALWLLFDSLLFAQLV